MKANYVYVFVYKNFKEAKKRFQNWKNAGFNNKTKKIGISYTDTDFETVVNSIEYAMAGFRLNTDYIIVEF